MTKRSVPRLSRLHHSGTRAILREANGGWRIDLEICEGNKKPLAIAGYLSPTEQRAKELADSEILSHGHVCNASCKGWERV